MTNSRNHPVVVGLGEVLWDLLPGGKQLGGAPANFAYHARVLGAEAYVASSVGDDADGREILSQLDRLGLDRHAVSIDPFHPTGTVSVELDSQGKPAYVIHEDVAWDYIATTPQATALARRADVVCFGSLAQRCRASRATIAAFLAATRKSCLRIFDINLRQHYYDARVVMAGLRAADVLKLNDEELPVVAQLLGIFGGQEYQLRTLLIAYGLRLVALTRGSQGATLISRLECSTQPAPAADVVDTVGAGDAFTAALAMGLRRKLDLATINRQACRLAAYVCGQPGATPPVPQSVLESVPSPAGRGLGS